MEQKLNNGTVGIKRVSVKQLMCNMGLGTNCDIKKKCEMLSFAASADPL